MENRALRIGLVCGLLMLGVSALVLYRGAAEQTVPAPVPEGFGAAAPDLASLRLDSGAEGVLVRRGAADGLHRYSLRVHALGQSIAGNSPAIWKHRLCAGQGACRAAVMSTGYTDRRVGVSEEARCRC